MHSNENSTRLLEMAVDSGFLTRPQITAAFARQAQLQKGGVTMSIAQVLLERRLLAPAQLKRVMESVEKRYGSERARDEDKPTGKIAQYTIYEELESSGNARVFRAKDSVMDRTVRLKLLTPSGDDNENWEERFKREMILAAKLQHPNIITTYSGGKIEGHLIISMEHVPGFTLWERLEREGNIPEKIAWLIAREVAKALSFAAKHGILHRDINPKAIFLGDDGKVKLGEFGLSKALTDQSNLTSAGTTVGSAFYISPEQARGTGDLDPRTDIYSLGATVFHMLTGSFPFMSQSMVEVMHLHSTASRPDPRGVLPEISAGSAELVMRMMALDMNKRPMSADMLISNIDALLQSLPDAEENVRKLTVPEDSEHEAPEPLRSASVKAKTKAMQAVARPDSSVPASRVSTLAPDVKPGILRRLLSWFGI